MQNNNVLILVVVCAFIVMMMFNTVQQEPFNCVSKYEDPYPDKHLYDRFPYNEYLNLHNEPKWKTYETPTELPNSNLTNGYCQFPRLTQDQYPYIQYQPKYNYPRFEQLRY